MASAIVFRHAGDQALLVEFENEISLEVSAKVKRLMAALAAQSLPGLGELIPAYRSLLVHYDPEQLSYHDLTALIRKPSESASALPEDPASELITEIPVCYEGEYAADLMEIAALEHKTPEEIIRIHSQSDYYVYMLGFAPGHPYGARMENSFSFKRRQTPRVKIPAGSIVVQLGLSDIIPFDQPCGWNISGTFPSARKNSPRSAVRSRPAPMFPKPTGRRKRHASDRRKRRTSDHRAGSGAQRL